MSAGRARRRLGAALALVAASGVAIGIVLADQSPSVSNAASSGGQGSGTATVQRRDLVQTDTESGTLSYANTRTVYNRLSGTITWLPAVGQVIKPGQALYRVAGAPVILMDGTTPAYRDLNASDSAGQDVLQLNRDLVDLGFNPAGIVIDDHWQAATTAAVEVFQEFLGESPTGALTLGQIVFLPGDQLVSSVSATLGSDGSSGGSGTPAADRGNVAAPEFVSLANTKSTTPASTTPASTTPSGTTPTAGTPPPSTGLKSPKGPAGGSQNGDTIAALTALLKAESEQLRAALAELQAKGSPNKPAGSPSNNNKSGNDNKSNNNSSGNNSGGGGGSATAIMDTSSTQLVVTVDLDATKQSEAKVGEKVTVEMPGGNTVNGTVTSVSPVAQSSSDNGNNGNSGNGNNGNSGSNATIPVAITLSGHPRGAGLDQAAVSVNFAQARARNVLSVPVTALLATGGGGYAVQESAPPHRLIPVTTGLFAAGYVEISGPGIDPGLLVTDSQG